MKRLNPDVYETIAATGMRMPDIPQYDVESYGQLGEDLIVLGLIRAFFFGKTINTENLLYLEIGGNHPVASSATYLLQKELGLRGVIVEANPELVAPLKTFRPNDEIVHAAVQTSDAPTATLYVSNQSELSSLDQSFVLGWRGGSIGQRHAIEVPAVRIDGLMRRHFGGFAPLFLSIDIEGCDFIVLQDLDLDRHRPYVIQIEPSEHHQKGVTEAIVAYLQARSYQLIARTLWNLIFIDAVPSLLPHLDAMQNPA